MQIKEIADECDKIAKSEIELYGCPTKIHYKLSMDVGIKLANQLGANVDVVRAGIALMDIKLGQCIKEGKQPEHVTISKEFSENILSKMNVDNDLKEILLNCIEAHHGAVEYKTLEAEIVANADCYRFIHPRGVMDFCRTVIKRGNEQNAALTAIKIN